MKNLAINGSGKKLENDAASGWLGSPVIIFAIQY